MEYAQEIETEISLLNYLFLFLDPHLYVAHTAEQ